MQQNNHDVWELTGALRQQEPIAGVDPVYMYTGGDKQITALELARQQGYENAWYPECRRKLRNWFGGVSRISSRL